MISTLLSICSIAPIHAFSTYQLQSSGEISARGTPLVINAQVGELFTLTGKKEIVGDWEIDYYESASLELLNDTFNENIVGFKTLKEETTIIEFSFKSGGDAWPLLAPFNTHQTVEVHICPRAPGYYGLGN